MPKAKATKVNTAENTNRVAYLYTHVGEALIIRANPTLEEVRGFVKEHNRRYHAGEVGGPSGIPAFLIHRGEFYDEELIAKDPETTGEEIDLADVL